MISFFDGALLRLKEQLQLSTDKEVATELGLSATAFNDRKRRDAFPEEKVLALSARRPDLKLDVTYILTGERVSELTRQQMAITGGVVVGRGDPAQFEAMLVAHKKLGQQQRVRMPGYKAHLGVLDLCRDEDVTLIMTLATRLAAHHRGK